MLVALACLHREVPVALSNPCGFPEARWGWPEGVLTGALVTFFLVMAAAAAGQVPGKLDMGSLGTSLALYVALILLLVGFLVFRGFDIWGTFGLGVRGWSWWLVVGWLLMFLPVVYFAQSLSHIAGGSDQGPQLIVDFLLRNSGWQARAAVCMLAVIVAPVTEELIFRGCLYGILRKYLGRTVAILVSAIVFALIHGHVPSLPGLVVLAVGLALVYERCGSLWAPLSMHAGFNVLSILAAIFWPHFAK